MEEEAKAGQKGYVELENFESKNELIKKSN